MEPNHRAGSSFREPRAIELASAAASAYRCFSTRIQGLHLSRRTATLVISAILATQTMQPVTALAASSLLKTDEQQTLIAPDADSQGPAVAATEQSKPPCSPQIRPRQDGYCPPPVVPEAPIAVLLPLNAAALLLLAAAYLAVRGRKEGGSSA